MLTGYQILAYSGAWETRTAAESLLSSFRTSSASIAASNCFGDLLLVAVWSHTSCSTEGDTVTTDAEQTQKCSCQPSVLHTDSGRDVSRRATARSVEKKESSTCTIRTRIGRTIQPSTCSPFADHVTSKRIALGGRFVLWTGRVFAGGGFLRIQDSLPSGERPALFGVSSQGLA